jgi:hypothetical protein
VNTIFQKTSFKSVLRAFPPTHSYFFPTYITLFWRTIFKSVQKAFTPAQIPSKHITVSSRATTHLQVSKTQGRLIILNITHKDAFHPPDLNHNKAGNCSLSILECRQGRATFQR